MTGSSTKSAPGKRSTVMDSDQLKRALHRIAHEIIELTEGAVDLALIGMQTRGVQLAGRLASYIGKITDSKIPVGVLDVTLYRDDFRTREKTPSVKPSDIPFDVDGRILVLVDDVLFTGRTVRAALDCLMDYGRPASIRLAVLVDRGNRDLPIRADFVGQEIKTGEHQEIVVKVKEIDDEDAVFLIEVP